MRLRVNPTLGHVYVSLVGTEPFTRLARPTIRDWADWVDEYAAQEARMERATTIAAAEKALLADGDVARMNARMIGRLLPAGVLDEHSVVPGSELWLRLSNRTITGDLLQFWRERPLCPWDIPSAPDDSTRKRRVLRTDLSPMGLAALDLMYRALAGRMSPVEVDRLEVWQCAVLLGASDPDRDLSDDERSDGPGMNDLGQRIVRNREGGVGRMSFRREPGAPYRFQRRPTVTLPA